MSANDVLTDEMMAWLMDNAVEISTWRYGRLTFEFRDNHLYMIRKEIDMRVGYEIKREELVLDKSQRVVYNVPNKG